MLSNKVAVDLGIDRFSEKELREELRRRVKERRDREDENTLYFAADVVDRALHRLRLACERQKKPVTFVCQGVQYRYDLGDKVWVNNLY